MTLRPELEPLPRRMRHLPVDARGYVVPWFVLWIDGVPEFRAMDRTKWVRAVQDRRCWVCGDVLGTYLTFVIGPMCGVNRTTAEPACHLDCAEWSARNCPFLSRPHMVRRDNDGLLEACAGNTAGVMLDRNPGVTLLWTTKSCRVFDDGQGRPLLRLGDPTGLAWYAEGRTATRAEIEASVAGGLPTLRAMAEQQDAEEPEADAVVTLGKMVAAFEAFYPEA